MSIRPTASRYKAVQGPSSFRRKGPQHATERARVWPNSTEDCRLTDDDDIELFVEAKAKVRPP